MDPINVEEGNTEREKCKRCCLYVTGSLIICVTMLFLVVAVPVLCWHDYETDHSCDPWSAVPVDMVLSAKGIDGQTHRCPRDDEKQCYFAYGTFNYTLPGPNGTADLVSCQPVEIATPSTDYDELAIILQNKYIINVTQTSMYANSVVTDHCRTDLCKRKCNDWKLFIGTYLGSLFCILSCVLVYYIWKRSKDRPYLNLEDPVV